MRLEMRCAIWNFWNLKLSNMSWEMLIWNFQMRLEMRCAIWNFWNLKLFKHVMGVAYLKLSDEIWDEMCYMKLLKLETSQTHVMGSCLFETFRWDLKKRCYLKFLKLVTFKSIMGSCLFKTFRWDLKWDVLFETFETCNFSNPSWRSCLFETFRWDLKKRCYLKFWKLVTFQIHHGELLI